MSVGQTAPPREDAGPRRTHGRGSSRTLIALVVHAIRLQRRGALIWGVVLGL